MGDIVNVTESIPRLNVCISGTGPIENVEVRNGLDLITVARPYQAMDLGSRIKITWCGAEVKGRNRMTRWDGHLVVRDNAIAEITPINFWNKNYPLQRAGKEHVQWRSATTGGTSGMILRLEKSGQGFIDIHTLQRDITCDISTLEMHPQVWDCGGLKKEISILRLPDQPIDPTFSFDLDLESLHTGDNPIYVRVTQEDAHMAWSSPIYLVKHT